jgi:hypothetical protein
LNTPTHNPTENDATEDKFFVSAVHQEMFNRIFPHIRHDLVGGLSASLMRVTIMDRHLNKLGSEISRLNPELKKIEGHLKDTIVGIRELQFWDFDVVHQDTLCNILHKSVKLMASHLLLKNIQLSIQPCDLEEESREALLETKPLLYTVLCVFSYIEDHGMTNKRLNICELSNTVEINIENISAQDSSPYTKNRHLIIDQSLARRFGKCHGISIDFSNACIQLSW